MYFIKKSVCKAPVKQTWNISSTRITMPISSPTPTPEPELDMQLLTVRNRMRQASARCWCRRIRPSTCSFPGHRSRRQPYVCAYIYKARRRRARLKPGVGKTCTPPPLRPRLQKTSLLHGMLAGHSRLRFPRCGCRPDRTVRTWGKTVRCKERALIYPSAIGWLLRCCYMCGRHVVA